jgi:hypothetical protein
MIRRIDRRTAAMIIGAAAVGGLSWPHAVFQPYPGLDPSFQAGLHMAAARGMDVGVEVVSTYGPLGFLSLPVPVYGFTSALALLHTIAIHFTLVWILVHQSAAVLPLWAALGLSFVGAQTIRWLGVPETALVLSTIIALWLLHRASTGRTVPDWAFGAGALGVAILGLGKLTTGAVIVAIAIVIAVAIGSRRQVLIFLGGLGLFSVVLWFAAGQGVANVVPFISSSVAIFAGFNAAMGLDQDQTAYWMVAAAGVVTAALLYARFEAVTSWPLRHRVALTVVLALVLFMTYKTSFVRWHFTFVFATLVLVSIATWIPRMERRTGLLAVATTLAAFLGATQADAWGFLDPSPWDAVNQRHTLFANAETTRQNRHALAGAYAIDESILGRIRGESVHIGPLESGVAFAHDDLVWKPLPVYQDYTVYTAGLDEINRSALLDADAAPRFILRGPPVAIDGKHPWFEGPATMRAMLCLYDEVEVAGQWQLLERGADRCAEPRLLSRIVAEPGEAVPVPRMEDGDAMLFVRIDGIEPTLAESAWSFAFKAHEWYITRNETGRYRLVAPTAGQGLVMAVGPELSYATDFGFGPAWRSVTVAPGPSSSVAATAVELEFWAVGIAGAAAAD